MEPLLRWAGSKRRLLSRIKAYLPSNFTRYVEPFAGSACMFFDIEPTRALIGDLNSELIATYRIVRHDHNAVAQRLAGLGRSRNYYYYLRALQPRDLMPVDRAARFIYLNRFCFNGLYRTNSKGDFNVPFGRDHTGVLPSEEQLGRIAIQLRAATLRNCSFEKLLPDVAPGDVVYMDPPYSVARRRIFREYTDAAFNATHLRILRQWMDRLTANGILFILSYADSSEGRVLAQGYKCEIVATRRNIAGFTSKRRIAREVIITNRNRV
jgi:DNA adenine methylase (dam)